MLQSPLENIALIILDRDGVINKKADLVTGERYILKVDDLNIYPDFFDFAAWAESANIILVVATNQQGLALNLLTQIEMNVIHEKIQQELQRRGLQRIRSFYICGHLVGTCECRKPSPGLLLEILRDFKMSPTEVIVIGDSVSDKLAATALKIRFIQMKRDRYEDIFASEYISSFSQLIGMRG
jgi:histidinol-phosphate phosphatase family protein